MNEDNLKWYVCPKCWGNLVKIRPDTEVHNLPLFCKKCKNTTVINIIPKSRVIPRAD